jgi:hypothetical protein
LRILIVGIRAGLDTIITIFSKLDENSGMTVLRSAKMNENSGKTSARTGGEKWPKIDGNYGRIGESYSETPGTLDMIGAHGGGRIV